MAFLRPILFMGTRQQAARNCSLGDIAIHGGSVWTSSLRQSMSEMSDRTRGKKSTYSLTASTMAGVATRGMSPTTQAVAVRSLNIHFLSRYTLTHPGIAPSPAAMCTVAIEDL